MSRAKEPPVLSRPETAREGNDKIAAEADRLHFLSRLPMLCECSDPDCRALVLIQADAYAQTRRDSRHFVTAPCHWLENAQVFAREDEYWVQRRESASD